MRDRQRILERCQPYKTHPLYLLVLTLLLMACRSQELSSPSVIASPVPTTVPEPPYRTAETLRLEWLQPSDCDQPCWEGISIGEMTRDEAIEWLMDKSYEVSTQSGWVQAQFNYLTNHGVTKNGVSLESKTLGGDAPITGIIVGFPSTKLGEVITLIGEPSHLLVWKDPAPHSDEVFWEIHVIWLEQGLDLYRSGVHEPPNITEDLRLVTLSYFFPTREGYNEVSPNGDFFREWEGYRNFSFYDATEEVMNAP
jgi:hypothetical protein